MDAMQNESAMAEGAEKAEEDAESVTEAAGETVAESATESTSSSTDEPAAESAAEQQPADSVPQPRSAEPELAAAAEGNSGKAKKRKVAPKAKSAGTKSLVVFREGKVHYADETVVVLDLDDAAHPDTDVHDVVDKLSELRDAVESPGRSEAVTLVAELIQAKALA
jgi:hypothetical protein